MTFPKSAYSSETKSNPAVATTPRLPRIDSLLHQLQRAKDADGQRIPLLGELFLFLDDPPRGVTDRWKKGADLCRSHGIKTSRMSVWRLYHAYFLQCHAITDHTNL